MRAGGCRWLEDASGSLVCLPLTGLRVKPASAQSDAGTKPSEGGKR